MAVHMESNSIFWTARTAFSKSGGIFRIKPDGSDFQEIITTGLRHPGLQGITIDWLSGMRVLLYLKLILFLKLVRYHINPIKHRSL